MERKRREIVEGEEENLKWKGKGMKMSKRTFFSFFFFFLFFFFFGLSLFETIVICLGCTKMEISMGKNWILEGNFLTPLTFDCTPSNAPV